MRKKLLSDLKKIVKNCPISKKLGKMKQKLESRQTEMDKPGTNKETKQKTLSDLNKAWEKFV